MRFQRVILFGAVAVLLAGQAAAFGTVSFLGQNREHERITRHALACGEDGGPTGNDCFEAASLDELAGASTTFGAVGAPDNPARGLMSSSAAHCDNGDYLDPAGGAAYAQTPAAARATLETCRAWMLTNFTAARTDAAALLNADGSIDGSQIPPPGDCNYNGRKGRAKCNVVEDLGLTLHATEDFYSHTNFVDAPDPAQPISRANPPGLHQDGPSPWLDLSKATADVTFPDGLISGCFQNLRLGSDQNGCPGRVPHEFLNKDKGGIDNANGQIQFGAGTTARGAIGDNFQRAVRTAIADTRRQWASLRAALITAYGQTRGGMMICAITHDDPSRTCH